MNTEDRTDKQTKEPMDGWRNGQGMKGGTEGEMEGKLGNEQTDERKKEGRHRRTDNETVRMTDKDKKANKHNHNTF